VGWFGFADQNVRNGWQEIFFKKYILYTNKNVKYKRRLKKGHKMRSFIALKFGTLNYIFYVLHTFIRYPFFSLKYFSQFSGGSFVFKRVIPPTTKTD